MLPDGSGASIWQSGNGPAVASNGHVYVATANGPFDPTKLDYGDSVLKLTNNPLSVGTGFTEKGLADAVGRLRPFFIDKPPVENPPKIPEKIQWVKPVFVCEVAFAEWTEDERLRQTTFLGWWDDKDAEEVVI